MNLNRVLRRIFGPKRGEITGEWREVHNEELTALYCSSNIFRVIKLIRMRRAGHVARMGERRVAYRILVRKSEGNRSLGRPSRTWKDTIFRMNLQEAEWDGLWTRLIWLRIGTGGRHF